MNLAILIDSLAATFRAGTGLPLVVALRTAIFLAMFAVAVVAMPETLRRNADEYADEYAA